MVWRALLLLSASLLVTPWSARAQPERWVAPPAHQLVVASLPDIESAAREAERAGRLLELPVQRTTRERAESPRSSWDHSVSVHQTASGYYEVVAGGGAKSAFSDDLDEIRRHYPSARIEPSATVQDGHYSHLSRYGIVVAGSFESFPAASRAAERLARASSLVFDHNRVVFDDENGLGLPESNEHGFGGVYFSRRYDGCDGRDRRPCVTIEHSEAFGFEPGFLIVVAGVLRRGEDRDERLALVRETVPDAFVKEATLYTGCRL